MKQLIVWLLMITAVKMVVTSIPKIFIQPQVNANKKNSEIDFVNENQPTEDASILSGNQLLGFAVLLINTPFG